MARLGFGTGHNSSSKTYNDKKSIPSSERCRKMLLPHVFLSKILGPSSEKEGFGSFHPSDPEDSELRPPIKNDRRSLGFGKTTTVHRFVLAVHRDHLTYRRSRKIPHTCSTGLRARLLRIKKNYQYLCRKWPR